MSCGSARTTLDGNNTGVQKIVRIYTSGLQHELPVDFKIPGPKDDPPTSPIEHFCNGVILDTPMSESFGEESLLKNSHIVSPDGFLHCIAENDIPIAQKIVDTELNDSKFEDIECCVDPINVYKIKYCEGSTFTKEKAAESCIGDVRVIGVAKSGEDTVRSSDNISVTEIENLENTVVVGGAVSKNCNNIDVNTSNNENHSSLALRKKKNRIAKPKLWSRAESKINRMRGETYVGFRRADPKSTLKVIHDTVREARVMGPPCDSPQCRKWNTRFCASVTREERQQVFHEFWKVFSWEYKRMYVCSTVDIKDTKQKTAAENSRRSSSFFYHLKIKEKRLPVCRDMYLNTLGVKRSEVHYWLQNFHENNIPTVNGIQNLTHSTIRERTDYGEIINSSSKHTLKPGTSKQKSPKLQVNKKVQFEQQIGKLNTFFDMLPTLPSHYCQQNSTKLFLQTDITSWSELHAIYKRKCEEDGEKPLSKFTFFKKKNEKNIEIYIPKKDQCDTCSRYKDKQISEQTYKEHQTRKDSAQQEKERDKVRAENGECHTLCFDLMAVQTLPRLRVSSEYCKLKLAVHCFTICNISTRESMAYWFDETQGLLCASTLATCVCDYLNELLDQSTKTIVLYSDGCRYQNRNSILSNALLHLSMARQVTIIQKYLEEGHTQMECDSVYSTIERNFRNIDIHLPSQYVAHSLSARKIPNRHFSKMLSYTFFKNYGQDTIYSSICPGKGPGEPTVNDIRWLQYDPEGKIFYKLKFEDDLRELPTRPKNASACFSFPNLYSARLEIPLDKWKDLQSLKVHMPSDTHHFYENIPHEGESRRQVKRQQEKLKPGGKKRIHLENVDNTMRLSD